jgi:hypothetical protein
MTYTFFPEENSYQKYGLRLLRRDEIHKIFLRPLVKNFLNTQGLNKQDQSFLQIIVSIEWSQFDQVHGLGGRASCQDDIMHFFIYRVSQYVAFPHIMLPCICAELERSEQEGRNLIEEKYAQMMKKTDPDDFNHNLSNSLRSPSPVKKEILVEIGNIIQKYVCKAASNLPKSHSYARPDISTDKKISSIDYFIAELSSYSLGCLFLLKNALESEKDNATNPVEEAYRISVILSKIVGEA